MRNFVAIIGLFLILVVNHYGNIFVVNKGQNDIPFRFKWISSIPWLNFTKNIRENGKNVPVDTGKNGKYVKGGQFSGLIMSDGRHLASMFSKQKQKNFATIYLLRTSLTRKKK